MSVASKLHLKDVRLAFPELYEATAFQNTGPAKFRATFLFSPEHPCVKEIKKVFETVAKAAWLSNAVEVYKGLKAADRLALHDGATKAEYAGYTGNLYVNASNEIRPTLVDGNRNPLVKADGKLYSGCYVNAIVEFWAQGAVGSKQQWGRRINACLLGVQFLRDGERLAGGAVASEDDFEAIPGAEGAASVFGDESENPVPGGNVFD